MYEFTKTVKSAKNESYGKSRNSEAGAVLKFVVRIASLFMVYFLLDNNFNFFNCAVSIFLIMTELFDVLSEKNFSMTER